MQLNSILRPRLARLLALRTLVGSGIVGGTSVDCCGNAKVSVILQTFFVVVSYWLVNSRCNMCNVGSVYLTRPVSKAFVRRGRLA